MSRQTTLALIVAKPGPLRDSLQALISTLPQVKVVAEASEPSALLQMSDRIRPDIVLVDASQAKDESWGVLEEIHSSWPQGRIIVLVENSQQQKLARNTGADIALLKGFPAARLTAVIEEFLV